MGTFRKLLYSRIVNLALGALLASIWTAFAWTHIVAFQSSHNPAFLAFFVSESLQALMFLIRREPLRVSEDLFAWAVGIAGTFVPLLLRPEGAVLWQHGGTMLLFGVLIQIAALLSLNRSFAIVAAERAIKMSGLYRYVRHPMYASYFFLFGGYVLFNASLLNAVIVAFALSLMYLRLNEEEKLLVQNPAYAAYMKRVRWRLVPFFY